MDLPYSKLLIKMYQANPLNIQYVLSNIKINPLNEIL